MFVNKLHRLVCLTLTLLSFSFAALAQENDEKIQDLLDNAEHLTINNRVDDAIAVYDQIIKLAPNKPLSYYRKGELFITKGRFIDAIKTLEQGVKIENPSKATITDKTKVSEDYLNALELLGNLYSQLFKAKNAVFYYESAYNLDDNTENKLRYQLEILNILFAVHRHQFSKKYLDKAKALQPENFDVRFFEGLYYNELEQYEEALPILEKLIAEVPKTEGNEKYFFELGKAYFELGKYQKAKAAFKDADGGSVKFRLKEYQPEYFYMIAQALYDVLEFEISEEYLKIALQLDPGMTKAHELNQKIAGINQPKGKLIDAKKAAVESAEKEGKTDILIENYRELAALYYQNSDYELSLDAIENWEALAKDIDLYRTLLKSMVEYKMNQPDEGLIMLNKVVKNPRMNPVAKARFHLVRGLIYMSQDKLKEAEAAFRGAYKGPFRPVCREYLNKIVKIKAKRASGLDDEEEDKKG
ncbi:MAG: tetratricopeptide repeat protein [Flammeovirgaceae bacterium]